MSMERDRLFSKELVNDVIDLVNKLELRIQTEKIMTFNGDISKLTSTEEDNPYKDVTQALFMAMACLQMDLDDCFTQHMKMITSQDGRFNIEYQEIEHFK